MTFNDDTFYLSASALSTWGKCPFLYRVTKIDHRESVKVKSGREFGHIVHEALAERYCYPNDTPSEALSRLSFILQHAFEHVQFPDQDYHTLSYATDLIQHYLKEYPTEPFEVVTNSVNEPIIEKALMVPLCDLEIPELHPRPIHVVWTGIIDALIRYPDGTLEHLDHKTSSRGGQTFFDEYVNDIAQTGYTWALRKQGFPVKGFTINALITPKPTVKGITNWQFLRQRLSVDDDQLIEWEANTINIVKEMFTTFASNVFPLHRWNCVGKYGRCDLYELCSFNHNVRNEILRGNNFRDTKKSPIYANRNTDTTTE